MRQKLYVQGCWTRVVRLPKAMKSGGKDGVIRHVMSGVDPADGEGVFVQDAFCGGSEARIFMECVEVLSRGRARWNR